MQSASDISKELAPIDLVMPRGAGGAYAPTLVDASDQERGHVGLLGPVPVSGIDS